MDLFSGTFATVEACPDLSKYRHLVGCEVDAKCGEASMEPPVGRMQDRFSRTSPILMVVIM